MTIGNTQRRALGLLGAAGAATILALGGAPAMSAAAATTHANSGHMVRHHAVTASEADNGTTITVRHGSRVTLTLHSTYWSIQGSSDPGVLHQVGRTSTRPAPPRSKSCVPGQGCGTVSASFVAVKKGHADLTASRTSCGEAMLCAPGQRDYIVHIVVAG